MFDTGGLLPVDEVPAGTTLLVTGPPMAGKRSLALGLLAAGADPADATVLVSTDSSSAAVRAEYEHAVDGPTPSIGVVDCAGDAYEDDGAEDPTTQRVASPADLGAVGTATTELLDDLDGGGIDRVGLFSLTTLSVRNGGEAPVRFVHALSRAVDERGGLAVLTAHSDTLERRQIDQLRAFVDGTLFVREGADGIEARLEGLDAPDEWFELSVPARVRADVTPPDPDEPATPTAAPVPSGSGVDFDSFAELIERVDGDRPTLTVVNRQSPDERMERIRNFFADLDVDVRETATGTERPRDVALLHRGPSMIAASSLSELAGGVAAATAEDDPFEQRSGPDVLEALDERVFGARGVGRQLLIDASTAIEMTAWQTGGGTLTAGFQELSRYWESPRSRRVMRRVAESGVEVNVYGAPDVVPDPDHENVTVRPDASPEIAETWFLAYDGDGRTDRTGALVVRETEPDEYHGFWTYEPSLATDVFAYVSETYGVTDGTGQQATP